jgi:hypothetical protein
MPAVSLTPSPDLQAAAWITEAEEDWTQLAGFGPAGLPGYVRVRILPDPERPFQSEADVHTAEDALSDEEHIQVIVDVLSRHTSTPEDAYFGLWDGWGTRIPGFKPMMRIPNRDYYLFRGPLTDLGRWGTEEENPPVPAFVWPADRAWCLAKDVDQHWVGVGAGEPALHELLTHPKLDVVKADPAEQQPFYL